MKSKRQRSKGIIEMEQTSEVQISVIMPVYNARDYVEQ